MFDSLSRNYLSPSFVRGFFVGTEEGSWFASMLCGGVFATKASNVETRSVGLKPLTSDPIDPSGDHIAELSIKAPVSV